MGCYSFLGLILFNIFSYLSAEKAEAQADVAVAQYEEYELMEGMLEDERGVNRALEVGRVLIGVLVLVLGANSLVEGATNIARTFGISELVIGITLVAFGTSLPELATSMVSAFRNEDDISVGNIIGSNIYNLLAVLGITSMVQPIAVAPSILRFELPVMLLFSVILWPLLHNEELSHWKGALLFVGYVVFTASLFIR